MHRCPFCGGPCDCDEMDREDEWGTNVGECSHNCGDDEPEDDDD